MEYRRLVLLVKHAGEVEPRRILLMLTPMVDMDLWRLRRGLGVYTPTKTLKRSSGPGTLRKAQRYPLISPSVRKDDGRRRQRAAPENFLW
jgi:hypothetical protein